MSYAAVLHMPRDGINVGTVIRVELRPDAIPLSECKHPKRAVYWFGPEDGAIPAAILERCVEVVQIPSSRCLNLAVASGIVMYDRIAKIGVAGRKLETKDLRRGR